MTKPLTLTYGTIDVPTSVTPIDIILELVDGNGATWEVKSVPLDTPSASFEVVSGLGWKVRASTRVSGTPSGRIGPIVETAPFDVVETKSISVVVGIS